MVQLIDLIQKADNISILCKKVAATSRSIRRAITTTRLIGTVGLKESFCVPTENKLWFRGYPDNSDKH